MFGARDFENCDACDNLKRVVLDTENVPSGNFLEKRPAVTMVGYAGDSVAKVGCQVLPIYLIFKS